MTITTAIAALIWTLVLFIWGGVGLLVYLLFTSKGCKILAEAARRTAEELNEKRKEHEE